MKTIVKYIENMSAVIIAQHKVDVEINDMSKVMANKKMCDRFEVVAITVAKMVENGVPFSETRSAIEWTDAVAMENFNNNN